MKDYLRFAQTKPNYKSKILKLLWANNFSQKMLYNMWMKKIEFTTTQDLFDELIVISNPRSYDSDSIIHENKIWELQSEYDKFVSFSDQFDYKNLEMDDELIIFRLPVLESKKFWQHAMKRILEQLKIYPLPLVDVFDLVELILDIGKQKWFLPNEKSYIMENFIKDKMPNLYTLWLNNPEQRNELIDNVKTQYKDLKNPNDVVAMSLDIPQ